MTLTASPFIEVDALRPLRTHIRSKGEWVPASLGETLNYIPVGSPDERPRLRERQAVNYNVRSQFKGILSGQKKSTKASSLNKQLSSQDMGLDLSSRRSMSTFQSPEAGLGQGTSDIENRPDVNGVTSAQGSEMGSRKRKERPSHVSGSKVQKTSSQPVSPANVRSRPVKREN